MTAYRLYNVDRTGKIVSVRRLDADCDQEAVDFAAALNRQDDCELWKGSTFVATIPSMAQSTAPRPVI